VKRILIVISFIAASIGPGQLLNAPTANAHASCSNYNHTHTWGSWWFGFTDHTDWEYVGGLPYSATYRYRDVFRNDIGAQIVSSWYYQTVSCVPGGGGGGSW
jgi:hypothetical protein